MKVSELMAGHTPSSAYVGIATNDDFVLAIDISESANEEVGNYEVVQGAIASMDASLESETDEKTYIREGMSTTKTSTQRTFNISGDRKHGVAIQDFIFSHAIKFGTGQAVIRPYVYFSMLTGEGEKGEASIIVNSDGGGDAGASAEIDVDISATGTPTAYTYSADEL